VEITLGLFGRLSSAVPTPYAIQGLPSTQQVPAGQHVEVLRTDRATGTTHMSTKLVLPHPLVYETRRIQPPMDFQLEF
jgi:hypothetical protein